MFMKINGQRKPGELAQFYRVAAKLLSHRERTKNSSYDENNDQFEFPSQLPARIEEIRLSGM
jgi:hypothetical protein